MGALRYQAQAVLEREGSGYDQGREFAQRVAGYHVGPDAQRLGQNDRVEEDGGLRHLGLLQFVGRAGEHDVGDAEAEDFVGLLEKRFGLGNVIVEVFAHADGLSSLTRQNHTGGRRQVF